MTTSTGHELGDAVLPAALQLVGAVRTGDPHDITDAIADAFEAAGRHPYWNTALVLVLAGLVPDNARPSELLAWTDPYLEVPAPWPSASASASRSFGATTTPAGTAGRPRPTYR